MEKYLEMNKKHYDRDEGVVAENVESCVFRFYGRILKHDFKMDGSKHNKLLDFGCGNGANLKFFKSKGFDVYGVDMCETGINRCKEKMPDIKNQFKVIDPTPTRNMDYFGEKFDVIIGIQSLYFLSNTDLDALLKSFCKMLNPGGIVYFTMINEKSERHFNNAVKVGNGLYKVSFDYPRLSCHDFYVNIMSEREMLERFKTFSKKHIGFYSEQFREDEEMTYHITFVGEKIR